MMLLRIVLLIFIIFWATSNSLYAQTNKPALSDEVLAKYSDSLSVLRDYISTSGLPADSLAPQFHIWMRKYPKSSALPRAIGEKYFAERNKKAAEYFYKVYLLKPEDELDPEVGKMFRIADAENWHLDLRRSSHTVDSLVAIIDNNPDDIKALEQFIFLLDVDNDTVTRKFDQWIQQFPRSTVIPFIIGSGLYEKESPKATPYLLRVVKLNPAKAEVWAMLAIDAERWGDEKATKEYWRQASATAPENPGYAINYAMTFQHSDSLKWRNMLWDLAHKFPEDDRGAQCLYFLAMSATSSAEKINLLEKLRSSFPPTKFSWSTAGMFKLYDLYINNSEPVKAKALAVSMGSDNDWDSKAAFAENVYQVDLLVRQKKYDEAYRMINDISAPRYSSVDYQAALLKASVSYAAGNILGAYDSLLVLHAKSPNTAIKDALKEYGHNLGKSFPAIDRDIWKKRETSMKLANDFTLGLYTSKDSLNLKSLRGKVVFITFWFPGCGPCRAEFPHFEKVVSKFKGQALAYLGINVYPDQDDYVLPFLHGNKYSFTPLRGNTEWALRAYNVKAQPSNFIIDQDGQIVFADFMINGSNESTLEMMIAETLQRKK